MVILMAISTVFSVVLYSFAERELSTSLQQQYVRIYDLADLEGSTPPYSPWQIRNELKAAQGRLIFELAYFNLIILILGSGVSYWLAKRTVRPIEEALEAQSRFTADASHELRTPLAAMQTEIEVAKRDKNLTKAETQKLLDSNLEEVGKLRALADGLLRLARNDTAQLAVEPVSLAAVAEAAVKRVAILAKEKGITIKRHTKADVVVQGSSQGLTDIAVILLDNAIKYSPAKTTVVLAVSRQGRQGCITVSDEGPGIAEEDLPHIFERFYRADASRTRNQVEGHGLGLSIARKIADLHEGKIEASNRSGKGAEFRLALPLA